MTIEEIIDKYTQDFDDAACWQKEAGEVRVLFDAFASEIRKVAEVGIRESVCEEIADAIEDLAYQSHGGPIAEMVRRMAEKDET